jgi:predicted AAA+ superfamily ATPase
MPGIADVGLDQEKALVLLEDIYSTVILRDILEHENRRAQKRITDPVLMKKIVMFLADNIGRSISYVLLESITSLISDLETICLDSETVIADMQ